ncbi:MFS transporter [Rhizobium calliandrae]|uniref:MFS transporter n=1 Tax=Rhizobium calliandrae TaxID=1312182 RepID=A0ABT7K824_9HYPH|nr:MFS transporter [Rhizobium calliandrae]MDL2404759.1 MFS transporter [Rhizobium calliandrae]
MTESAADKDDRSRLTKSLTLAGMSLGYAVVQLDVTIVNTALSSIGKALGGGVPELQWVVTVYTIAFAALILTAGALGDRVGAKKTFMAGFAIFTVASLACALAPTPVILIAARALQGIGAAILVPNSLALLNHAYPNEKERGRAVGTWAAGASLALMAGPFVGGGLIAIVGWRSIFFVNLPIGLAGLWLTWRWAKETTPSPYREFDLVGQTIAIGALGCLAATIIEGGTSGWGNSWVVAGFIVSAILIALFLLREQHAEQPMLPLGLFKRRLFSQMSLAGLLVNVPFYGLIFVLSLYFQQVNDLSPFETGLAFLPMMAAVFPANLLAARAAQRFGALPVIAAGALIAAAGCIGLLGIGRGTSYWAMLVQFLAMGSGLGLLVPPLTSTLLGSVEKARSGVAAGVLNSARQTGSVLGVALFGSFVGQINAFVTGAREALVVSTTLLVGAAITTTVRGWSTTE